MYDALLFLGRDHVREATALRWRHYDSNIGPLGKLRIARSYSTKLKVEKEVKTLVARVGPLRRSP